MYHFFVSPEQIGEKEIRITGGDVNHIRNVLRMPLGEQITVSCALRGEEGDTAPHMLRMGGRFASGKVYRCEIAGFGEDYVTAKIRWAEEAGAELPCRITLFQGLPKGDKMELIIQKAVELGASEIVPVACRRSVVRLDAKKAEAKGKRWNAVSESAAKQAKRALIPAVKPVMSFAEAARYASACPVRLIPYELARGMDHTRKLFASIRPGDSIALFIGPEGGFEEGEVALAREHGFEPVTLGRRILRCETAGMAVLAALMIALEKDY